MRSPKAGGIPGGAAVSGARAGRSAADRRWALWQLPVAGGWQVDRWSIRSCRSRVGVGRRQRIGAGPEVGSCRLRVDRSPAATDRR
jgi:hypothetical protein